MTQIFSRNIYFKFGPRRKGKKSDMHFFFLFYFSRKQKSYLRLQSFPVRGECGEDRPHAVQSARSCPEAGADAEYPGWEAIHSCYSLLSPVFIFRPCFCFVFFFFILPLVNIAPCLLSFFISLHITVNICKVSAVGSAVSLKAIFFSHIPGALHRHMFKMNLTHHFWYLLLFSTTGPEMK